MRTTHLLLFAVVLGFNNCLLAQPAVTLQSYISALKASNWEAAEKCWTPEAISASKHLGIIFTDFLPKYDNASPLVTQRDAILAGQASVKVGDPQQHETYCTIPVFVVVGKDSVQTTYYLEEVSGKWLLTAPLFLFTRDWRTIETGFCQVHYRDSTLINQYALKKLDDCVDRILGQLNAGFMWGDIRQIKFDYYLGNADDVKRLTGFETYGMTNLQFDAVITQYLPHPHEIVHLLIDYALGEQPLYTMAFMQEGLACYLGGRWGKSPEVIRMVGSYMLRNKVVELDSVLTWSGFNTSVGMPDLTYPVSAVFVEYMAGKRGMDNFLKIYREFSGLPVDLMSRSVKSIHDSLTDSNGTPWDGLMEDFLSDVTRDSLCGITPGGVLEPENKVNSNVWKELRVEQTITRIQLPWRPSFPNPFGSNLQPVDLEWIVEAKLTDEAESVTLLLTDTLRSISPTYQSRLFQEHFPELAYSSEIYGIRFTSRDAGLYNYLTNTLEAKYVVDFTPSDLYWNPEEQKVTFHLSTNSLQRDIWPMDVKMVVQKEK